MNTWTNFKFWDPLKIAKICRLIILMFTKAVTVYYNMNSHLVVLVFLVAKFWDVLLLVQRISRRLRLNRSRYGALEFIVTLLLSLHV